MVEQDTIRLLRECDAGIAMGVRAIDDVLDRVKSDDMREKLVQCKKEHEALSQELEKLLDRYRDEGKSPNLMAEMTSKMKTEFKLAVDCTDGTIADLMIDGCNMGVKSLNRYLNQYEAADEVSKDITKRLIHLEERLTRELRSYL